METVNRYRRRLLAATTTLGSVGLAFTAVPFIASMLPSARSRSFGSPVEVGIGKLEPGMVLTVVWRGRPVWVMRRTPAMLAGLKDNGPLLVDPTSQVASQQPPYAQNLYRSIRPEVLVLVGLCTHLGCVPTSRFTPGPEAGIGGDWPGGWFCPCHGSKFDLAGRVFKNVPAPTNLVVPPYHFVTDTRIVIGLDPPPADVRRV